MGLTCENNFPSKKRIYFESKVESKKEPAAEYILDF